MQSQVDEGRSRAWKRCVRLGDGTRPGRANSWDASDVAVLQFYPGRFAEGTERAMTATVRSARTRRARDAECADRMRRDAARSALADARHARTARAVRDGGTGAGGLRRRTADARPAPAAADGASAAAQRRAAAAYDQSVGLPAVVSAGLRGRLRERQRVSSARMRRAFRSDPNYRTGWQDGSRSVARK